MLTTKALTNLVDSFEKHGIKATSTSDVTIESSSHEINLNGAQNLNPAWQEYMFSDLMRVPSSVSLVSIAENQEEQWSVQKQSPTKGFLQKLFQKKGKTQEKKGGKSLRRLSSMKNIAYKGSNIVRRIVSKGRKRFVQNGFDLDLAYVTDRIISTSFPSSGANALFRNSMDEISIFLHTYHPQKYRVYNLCSESRYDPQLLENRAVRYPCDDMQPPSLEVLEAIIADAQAFLNEDPQHVIVVHCKAGKGRTGAVVCSLLLKMGICHTMEQALDLFAHRRTKNGKGVTIPSQQRYIAYYHNLLKDRTEKLRQQISYGGAEIVSLKLVNMIKLLKKNASGVCVKLSNRNVWTMLQTESIATIELPSMAELEKGRGQVSSEGYLFVRDGDDLIVEFDMKMVKDEEFKLFGDVKLQVFKGTGKMKKSLFYLWFNAGLEAENPVLYFGPKNLDKVQSKVKQYKLGVQVELCPAAPDTRVDPSLTDTKSIQRAVRQLQRDSDNHLARKSGSIRHSLSQPNIRSFLSGYSSNISEGQCSIKSAQSSRSLFNGDKPKKQRRKLQCFSFSNSMSSSNACLPGVGGCEDVLDMFERKWFQGL